MRTARILVFLILSLALVSCDFSFGYKPPAIPLSVSIDTQGSVTFSVEQEVKLPTPIGTFSMGVIVDPAEYFGVKNTLTVRYNGQDSFYDLHGENFDIKFESGYYEKIALSKTGNNLLLEIVRRTEATQEIIIPSVSELIPTPTPVFDRVNFVFGGGKFIAYTVNSGEKHYVNVYDVGGAIETQISSYEGSNFFPFEFSFSPDGNHIVFQVGFFPPYNGIYTIDRDGSNLKSLIIDGSRNWFPELSPDGLKIAFASDRYAAEPNGDFNIFTMNNDGTNIQRITDFDSSQPSWSPDNKKMVFQSQKDGNFEIYTMNSDGASVKRLTNNPTNDMAPQWSPDGKKICFSSDRDGNSEIYLMNPDGSEQMNLTNNPSGDSDCSWSPDSQVLVFASDRDATGAYWMLIETRSVIALPVGSQQISNPVWSK